MLEELSVRNFALIDSLTLSFEKGFSVLSGETGAGKSIIVGSLSFLLGAKADSGMIRSGCEEASVSAVILVGNGSRDALDWLNVKEIETEDSRVIIRRSLKTSGRSSIYIQNAPVTRTDLAEFMALLFDLHGQHTHETLLRKETHRLYLDRFAGLEEEALAFNKVFTELAGKKKALEASLVSERDRDARLEILNYGVDEISSSQPRSGEIRELEAEIQRLSGFERLANQANAAAASFFDGDENLLSFARRVKSGMEAASSIDESLDPLRRRMEDLFYEVEDIASEYRSYMNNLTYDPRRLEEAGERLALLYRLKKKYVPAEMPQGGDEEAILAWKSEAEEEIEALSGAEENRGKLKAEIAALEKDLAARAQALSAKRAEGAERLGKGISSILSRLGMPGARFSAPVTPRGNSPQGGQTQNSLRDAKEKAGITIGPWGADNVEFMISSNTGEPLKELARIASGGELSRVMLAVKTVLSESGAAEASPETLVFDEVDTGIGGEVALSVGEYLAQIGKRKQIFCVTHLATIAVRADNHLKVEKKVIPSEAGGRTVTGVNYLGNDERRAEIARLLSGDSGGAALAHADELLAKYGQV